ncbi:MAG: hypothetical protein ACR2NB_02245 [Solirubrobacteraceae bacterium]
MSASPNSTPAAHAAGTTAAAASAAVGPRKQLGRYLTPRGERVLLAQRVDGHVRVTDRPIARGGRSYVVARWVQSLAELQALTADYLAEAQRHGDCPMHCRW